MQRWEYLKNLSVEDVSDYLYSEFFDRKFTVENILDYLKGNLEWALEGTEVEEDE